MELKEKLKAAAAFPAKRRNRPGLPLKCFEIHKRRRHRRLSLVIANVYDAGECLRSCWILLRRNLAWW